MKILVLNAGSSSLKYSLFCGKDSELASHGIIENLTTDPSDNRQPCRDYSWALQQVEIQLKQQGLATHLADCDVVTHRVVHGGEQFHQAVMIDDQVITQIKALAKLAPLHNPINLIPIQTLRQTHPELCQVAIFDTAFHQTLPEKAYRYALPKSLYQQHQIRRYGFHGSSHQVICRRYADLNQIASNETHVISIHLGNGASICAIEAGKSIDTSMGFTPLAGLIMGTRSGDLDPAIPMYLINHLDYSAEAVDQLLNKQSGLLGLSGHQDMRELLALAETGNNDASLAIDCFVYRIQQQLGSYLAIMDKVQAVVFTGGIGEHSAQIRAKVLQGLSTRMGIKLDVQANEAVRPNKEVKISQANSPIACWVIPTQEEWEMAQQTLALLHKAQ
ncbi:acetate kinase [Hydrogenovibrio sp. SC-1]|uniref:acetate/propionate family kinase n=1 Tax=Hydrogenovibrio sp. SC-1 TaxID=2065820 RepID=UPI000C7DC6A0|nr:acetate kinase [Hydrogenovibrio sp. SC-1]PLA75274.1 acetate kinase [Hydrogenovibrio sp. SC-1]